MYRILIVEDEPMIAKDIKLVLKQSGYKVIVDLQKALDEVKTLSGLIPICSHCKKIRDDSGYWEQVEYYISKRSDVDFSHSICPECMKKYYPKQYEKLKEKGKI